MKKFIAALAVIIASLTLVAPAHADTPVAGKNLNCTYTSASVDRLDYASMSITRVDSNTYGFRIEFSSSTDHTFEAKGFHNGTRVLDGVFVYAGPASSYTHEPDTSGTDQFTATITRADGKVSCSGQIQVS